ncbi:MAG: hypothetical protein HRU32_16255, partial [Rhodobacteraceae bacterium]|nr:hypothetical protein [Paracoccaceae bacterium]
GGPIEDELPMFELKAYSVSLGRFIVAKELVSLGVELTLETPITVDLEDENGLITSTPDNGSLFVGEDDQGALTQVNRLVFTADDGVTEVTFVAFERENVADVLLLPIDPETGRYIPGDLGLEGDYTFVSSTPFDADLWLASLITGGDDADRLEGGDFADDIFAGMDDDEVIGGLGPDKLNGEEGNDVLNGDMDVTFVDDFDFNEFRDFF